MGRIIVSENVSLDGVVQDPTGEEGFRRGGWWVQVEDQDRQEVARVMLDEALGTEAMLLGRRSYEFLATRWPSRPGALADRLNSKPKYVVSSTLHDPAGHRLFGATSDKKPVRLVGARAVDNDLAFLIYQPARDA